jgi:hypothetical protein
VFVSPILWEALKEKKEVSILKKHRGIHTKGLKEFPENN